jgi:hypothetical protein
MTMLDRGATAALDRIIRTPNIEQIEGTPQPEQFNSPPSKQIKKPPIVGKATLITSSSMAKPSQVTLLTPKVKPEPTPVPPVENQITTDKRVDYIKQLLTPEMKKEMGLPDDFELGQRPIMTTPEGNKVTYPITQEEIDSMTLPERFAFEVTPQEWLRDKDDWAKFRVNTDRSKIIAETIANLGGFDLNQPLDSPGNTLALALTFTPLPKGVGGMIGKWIPKSAKAALGKVGSALAKLNVDIKLPKPPVKPVAPPVVPEVKPLVEQAKEDLLNIIVPAQKTARAETKELYAEARGPAFEKIKGLRETPTGEAMVNDVFSAMNTGELPRGGFSAEQISNLMSQEKKDALFNDLALNKVLNEAEVANGQKALMRILSPDKFRLRFPDDNVLTPLRDFELKIIEKAWGKDTALALGKDSKWLRRAMKLNDAAYEIYYNSLLGGKALVRNIGSNIFRLATNPIESLASATTEVPLSFIANRPRARFFGEVPAEFIGAWGGLRDGVRDALRIIKTGERFVEGASKYELPERAIPGVAGRIVNLASVGMDAGDALFMSPLKQSKLWQLAYRKASKEGLKDKKLIDRFAELKANPTQDMITQSKNMALDSLFREPSKFATWLMQGRDVRVAGFQPFRLIVPFIRVPINVAKYGLARSPVGALSPKMWSNIIKKDPEAADQIGRVMFGSSIAATLASYAAQGNLTGAAPLNSAERDRFYREGKQPFSIKIGDTWVSYQQVPLLATTLTMVASATDAIKNKTSDVDEKVAQSVYEISRMVVDQTFLTGLSDFLDAITDPERNGENWLTRTIPSLVPFSSTTRLAAQATDTTIRKPTNIPEAIESNLPGLSKNVPPKLTAMGETITRETPFWSPINITKDKEDALTNELNRLEYNLGFVGKALSGISLDVNEQQAYQGIAGQLSKQAILDLINGKRDEELKIPYSKLSDMAKVEALDSVVSEARSQARYQMFIEMAKRDQSLRSPEDQTKIQGLALTSQYYIDTKDYSNKRKDSYRATHPEIDAALMLWSGSVEPHSAKALEILKEQATIAGIPFDTIPALQKKKKSTTPAPGKATLKLK